MYAMMSAIALTGAVSFSACSSSDEIVDNPDYNPETNSVKTAITINIGRSNNLTRMASSITQNNGTFRGMYNVNIYPSTANSISGESSLSTPVVSNDNIGNSEVSSSKSNKTYSNKQLTVGTKNFLFYGRAGSADPSTIDNKLANGYTVPTFPSSGDITASGIYFTAQSIAPSTLPSDWTDATTALLGYLNGIIASTNNWNATSVSNPELGQLYINFTGTVLHAGSADAVLAAAQHLLDRINSLTLTGNDITVRENVIADIKAAPASFNTETGKLSWGSVTWATNFPANLGLPLGAAQYRFNSNSGLFEYVTTATLNAENTAVANYIYPCELFYFTNTPLMETSGNVAWPTTTGDWASASTTWNATSNNGWTNTVQATSKNIALVNNIQYGTAQLATYIKSVPDGSGKLYDNAKAFGETSNQALTYQDGMFQLTGVIIGAQPSKVGWNFLPTGTTSVTYDKCVYDKNVNYYALSNDAATAIYANTTHTAVNGDANSVADYSGPNYTLVYDNVGNTDAEVNVCLEFTNDATKGVDFYGKDGIVKKGQKFYLIGKLNPGSNKPNGFPNAAGSTNAVYYPSIDTRVFIQDYTTKAFFEISAGSGDTQGSLAHAYYTIPDLRTTNMEIGLSVDLEWKAGLEFTNIVLGE